MGELFIIIDEAYRRAFRTERVFRDRTNPLDIFNDDQLIKRYRFPRSLLLQIINMCHDDLVRPTNRTFALPVYCQVLCALRFYAKGSFQVDAGDIENISQPCVSRSIEAVTNILCQHANEYIKFPDQNMDNVKYDFFRRYKMPNTIGLVDGSLISIKGPPGNDEPLYVSRKGGHGINVQVVCDFNMYITDLVSKWPGATHDSFIWRNCGLRESFMANPPNGWLLGDSGYPLEPWLLVPISNPTTEGQEKYNRAFKKARSKVENCIGLWKSVFRCIDKSGGTLQYDAKKCCKIVVATAVLHNMRRRLRLPADELFVAPENEEPQQQLQPENELALLIRATETRNNLIQQHFN